MRRAICEALKLKDIFDESPVLGGEKSKCGVKALVTPIAPAGGVSRTEPRSP